MLDYFLKKWNRQSIIVFLLAGILGISALLIPIFGAMDLLGKVTLISEKVRGANWAICTSPHPFRKSISIKRFTARSLWELVFSSSKETVFTMLLKLAGPRALLEMLSFARIALLLRSKTSG